MFKDGPNGKELEGGPFALLTSDCSPEGHPEAPGQAGTQGESASSFLALPWGEARRAVP